MLELIWILIFAFVAAMFNRGAGGLWSYLIGVDVGAFIPRMLYGLSTMIPVLFLLPDNWITVGIFSAGGILQGLARGTGWHGSLDLGLKGPGYSVKEIAKKTTTMFLCGIGFYFPMSIVAAYSFGDWFILPIMALFIFPLAMVYSYCVAAAMRVSIPVLQCYPSDFPPFGELLSAFICEIIFFIFLIH